VRVAESLSTRTQRLGEKDALALLRDADELWSMKGKRVVHVERTLIVGCDEATFRRLFR
jgi:hypothetical protein